MQPGGRAASWVAFDPGTGQVLWESPGRPAAYASPIAKGGQFIGFDRESAGGWDLNTGARLWTLKPEIEGDFHVPAPAIVGDHLLLCSENNGTRLHAFDATGVLVEKPLAVFADFAPDSHTPVVVGNLVVGLGGSLTALGADSLRPAWTLEEAGLGLYASIISDGRERALALGDNGALVLFRVSEQEPRELGRLSVAQKGDHLLAHPALVGRRLFLRLPDSLVCLEL